MIAGDYSPTSTSLVRPPRRPRPPAPIGMPPSATGGTIPPFQGNGVMPQPPAGANPVAPPPTPPPSLALPPGAPPGSTAIDPNANLRGVQINPVNAADTQAARAGLVDQTSRITGRATPQVDFKTVGSRLNFKPVDTTANFQAVNPNAQFTGVNPNVAGGAGVDPAASARLKSQQGLVDENALKLAGVDRLKLAQEQFGTYSNATDPAFQKTIRDATEAAAAHGGLGSGMLTTQYGTLAGDRANALQTERDRLFQTAQEGSIADQFAKVAALQGLEGQTSGQEAAARGEQRTERGYTTDLAGANVARTQAERDAALASSERNIGRTQQERDAALAASERGIGRTQAERDAQAAIDQQNLGVDISERNKGVDVATGNADRTAADDYRKLGAATDLFSSLSGQDAAQRGEYRTERANQQTEAQAAEDSAVRQKQLEEALNAGDFERAIALAQYGDAGNPGAATIGVGAQQSQQSGQDLQGLLALLQQYGYGQATKKAA